MTVSTLQSGGAGLRGQRIDAEGAAGGQIVPVGPGLVPVLEGWRQMRRPDGAGAPELVGIRRLTPLEWERLQGFPDGWTATSAGRPQADSVRFRELGNSVAVPVFEWVARRIVCADAVARPAI